MFLLLNWFGEISYVNIQFNIRVNKASVNKALHILPEYLLDLQQMSFSYIYDPINGTKNDNPHFYTLFTLYSFILSSICFILSV